MLDKIDLDATIDKDVYSKRLTMLQAKLYRLSIQAADARVSSVVVFEGNDAGGKGGAIRRLTQAMEAGDYKVIPIAAPTPEERCYHYLWRFWRRLPCDGQMAIFDRSWYGRVLVERIEGYATDDEWQRAYDEINDFELQIAEAGDHLAKFWLAISPDEQLARFRARQETPYKQHKITDEDYRNREHWDDYVIAVDDMVLHTSTDICPWTLVPANDKRYAAHHGARDGRGRARSLGAPQEEAEEGQLGLTPARPPRGTRRRPQAPVARTPRPRRGPHRARDKAVAHHRSEQADSTSRAERRSGTPRRPAARGGVEDRGASSNPAPPATSYTSAPAQM